MHPLKLLAHPMTQPYISDGDQLALSYLESVSVHKALPATAAAAAAAATATAAGAGEQKAEGAAEKPSKSAGENGVREKPKPAAARVEELDDDDDVGFRVTFVSITSRENIEQDFWVPYTDCCR